MLVNRCLNPIHSVVVLSSSPTAEDLLTSDSLGGSRDTRQPVDFVPFVETLRQPGLSWLVLHQAPPV